MPPIGQKKKSLLSKLLSNTHTIIRFIFFSILLFGLYREYSLGELLPGRIGFGGPFKFLTYLNHLLQIVYLLLVIIVPPKISSQTSFTLQDRLFQIVLPVTGIVTTMFWFLHSQNMFGDLSHYPNDLNHIQHTLVAVIVLFELLLERKVGINNNFLGSNFFTQSIPLIVFASTYLAWISYLKQIHGKWAYSFMDKLNETQLILFSLGVVFVGMIFLWIGRTLNKLIYPAPLGITTPTSNKKIY